MMNFFQQQRNYLYCIFHVFSIWKNKFYFHRSLYSAIVLSEKTCCKKNIAAGWKFDKNSITTEKFNHGRDLWQSELRKMLDAIFKLLLLWALSNLNQLNLEFKLKNPLQLWELKYINSFKTTCFSLLIRVHAKIKSEMNYRFNKT